MAQQAHVIMERTRKLEDELKTHAAKSIRGLEAKTQDERDQIALPGDTRGPVRLVVGKYTPGSSEKLEGHTKAFFNAMAVVTPF